MRLFVGIALPDEIRARLVLLRGGLKGARWVGQENLHLSLRFIGAAWSKEKGLILRSQ